MGFFHNQKEYCISDTKQNIVSVIKSNLSPFSSRQYQIVKEDAQTLVLKPVAELSLQRRLAPPTITLNMEQKQDVVCLLVRCDIRTDYKAVYYVFCALLAALEGVMIWQFAANKNLAGDFYSFPFFIPVILFVALSLLLLLSFQIYARKVFCFYQSLFHIEA